MASIDIEIDDIMYSLSNYEKQELADELYEAGYIPKKLDKELDLDGSDWDEAVHKLLGNKFKLSKEDEETILTIVNKIV